MQPSLTPILVAVELGFVFMLARRSGRAARPSVQTKPVYLYLAWVAVYGFATGILGARGVYVDAAFLQSMPGLWLQLVTVAVCVAPVVLFSGLRQGLRRIVDVTPLHWFAYFQALRITALGTAYKAAIGQFPVYFEMLVGVPDLLFGLSALWVASKIKRGGLSERGFLMWNLIGLLVIVPAAPVLLQLGLPGPWYVFTNLPDARAVYTYPMSIAPMIGVPLFALVNFWVAWRLWERHGGRVSGSPDAPPEAVSA